MGSDMSKHLHPTFLIWQHTSPTLAKLVPSPVQLLAQAPPANVFTLLFLVGPQISLKIRFIQKSSETSLLFNTHLISGTLHLLDRPPKVSYIVSSQPKTSSLESL